MKELLEEYINNLSGYKHSTCYERSVFENECFYEYNLMLSICKDEMLLNKALSSKLVKVLLSNKDESACNNVVKYCVNDLIFVFNKYINNVNKEFDSIASVFDEDEKIKFNNKICSMIEISNVVTVLKSKESIVSEYYESI